MDAHHTAMAAIRKGQFKLRTPLQSKDHSQSNEVSFISVVQMYVTFRPYTPSRLAANAVCMKDSILVTKFWGGGMLAMQ